MRNVLMMAVGAIAAVAVATLFAQRATRHGERAESAQPNSARADHLSRQAIAPVHYAMINSLWGETSIAPCMIGAVWGEGASQASFAPQMRLSMRTPLTATIIAPGRVVTRLAPEIQATGDVDVAARHVALEPGVAPVVRVLKIADFRRPAPAARPERSYGRALRAA